MEIKVLDHGYVRLVDHMGSDLSIVRSARVSYGADEKECDEARTSKLIKHLVDNDHTTPLEAVVLTLEIKCPIFIARQWMRHRAASYNEISARYTEIDEEFYLPAADHIGLQSSTNKQSRYFGPSSCCATDWREEIEFSCKESFQVYNSLLKEGVPREIARTVLPLATYTRFYYTVNLHNLLHFITLRKDSHAQWEIQEYARAIEKILLQLVPETMKHYGEKNVRS